MGLKGAGKSVPNVSRMTTEWRNPEYVTDTEQANAATVRSAQECLGKSLGSGTSTRARMT
jgi:hypothetical protein